MSNVETNTNTALTKIGATAAPPASLPFDPARYRAEVDHFDLTEAQKQELLLTLWSIMRSFVELGFTVDVCAALAGDVTIVPAGTEVE